MTKLGSALRALHLRGLLLATVVSAAMITASTPAFATTSTCAPTLVGYKSDASSSYIAMSCGGASYYAWTAGTPTGCTAVSADAAKSWVSLAQAAVLSGKQVTVIFSTCSTSNWNYISELDLKQ
jgi:hypothetical protein